MTSTHLRQMIQHEHLKTFPDLNRLAKKFARRTASLQDVVRIYQCVIRLPDLQKSLSDYSGIHSSLLSTTWAIPLTQHISGLNTFLELVETAIDLEAISHHEFLIKHTISPDLEATKKSMDSILEKIEPEANRVARQLGMELGKKLKLEHTSVHGYHLRLSRNDATVIRGKGSAYRELACQKAGVLFQTPLLRELSDEYSRIKESYTKLQSSIEREVIETAESFFPVFQPLNALVAHLDVLTRYRVMNL